MRNRIRVLILPLAGAAAFGLAGCSSKTPGTNVPADGSEEARNLTVPPEQKSRIRVLALHATSYSRIVEVNGTADFDQNRSTQVIAGISGPVSRLLVKLGDRVSAGTPLAQVASADFAADVSTYRKDLVNARNLRRIADLDKKLFDAGGIPRRDMQQAETDAASAESDRDAALDQLRSIGVPAGIISEIQQGKAVPPAQATVRSPIPGTVVERLINPGQLLQAGSTPCFTIADLSTMWVMATVFQSDLPDLAVGETAEIEIAPGAPPLAGRVDYIGDVVDPATRGVPTRIVVPNRQGALKKGAYVRVRISSAKERRGLLVPTSGILRDDQNLPFVFVEIGDGSFSRRSITLGPRTGDRYEVPSGLKEGDRIVAEGGLFLQFAQSQ